MIFTGWGCGDPHYRSVTGRRFDYHGDGEFLLIEIGSERSQVQGILTRLGRRGRPAVHRSFAFGEPGRFAYQVRLVFTSLGKCTTYCDCTNWYVKLDSFYIPN